MELFQGPKQNWRQKLRTTVVATLVVMAYLFQLGCDIGEADPTPRGVSPGKGDRGTDKARENKGIFSRSFESFDAKVSHFVLGADSNCYLVSPPSEASSSSVLRRSADGEAWESLSLPPRTELGTLKDVAVGADGKIFVIGSESGGVYVSSDGTNSFERMSFGRSEPPLFEKLLILKDGRVLAANLSEFFIYSAEAQSFTRGRWPAGLPNEHLVVFSAHDQLFARVRNSTNQGIAGSKNWGESFTLREASVSPHFMAKDSTGTLFAIDDKGVLLGSNDKGFKFLPVGAVGTGLKVVDFAVDANNWLYVLTEKALYYSTDSGRSFKTLDKELGLNLQEGEGSPESFTRLLVLNNRRILISTSRRVFISE